MKDFRIRIGEAKKKPHKTARLLKYLWRRPTFPHGIAVSLALAGLTSLFGMGRGGPCRYNHPKVLCELKLVHYISLIYRFTVNNSLFTIKSMTIKKEK